MNTSVSYSGPIIDGHVHLSRLQDLDSLKKHCDAIGLRSMNIVCVFDRDGVNANPQALAAKARFPGTFSIFCGLDHSSYFSAGSVRTPSLAEQVDRALALGADGIKLIETKPTSRKNLDIPIDSRYFEAFFARVEELGAPLLWHVGDPEEFWDPDLTPGWAAERGWGYNESFVAREQLYAETLSVLEHHPGLTVIFPHFFFLSRDLERASELMRRFPGLHIDLAPGIEYLYNLSEDPARAREFFLEHSKRIVFGTDIFGSLTTVEARERAGTVRAFLDTNREFLLSEDADFLLGPPSDGIIRGIFLPEDALQDIYFGNFSRLAGDAPKPLNRELAAEECHRIARGQAWFTGKDAADTPAYRAAEMIG